MKKIKKVTVVMSTYNGERYLREQIESVLNQSYNNLHLLIRDDGSTDNTMKILEEFEGKYSNIKVYRSENIGVIKSFFELLKFDDSADYYAFCDQDDYWKPNKIERSIKFLEEYDSIPTVYFSNYDLVDEKLNIIKSNTEKLKPTVAASLTQNIITGCTCVLNKKIRDTIIEKIPEKCTMHDGWVYRVGLLLGKVIHDDVSTVLYRQHSGNVIGAKVGLNKVKLRATRLINRSNSIRAIDDFIEIKRLYNNQIKEADLNLISCFIDSRKNYLYRIKIFFNKNVKRKNIFDTVIYKLVYLLSNRYV